MFKNYFNDKNKYTEPTLIKFEEPVEIKFCELHNFLESYRPFACSDVYLYEHFEYGDFDNWVDAIIESKTIDVSFSRVYRKARGIYKAGQTSFCVTSKFWHYMKNKPFWREPLQTGYSSDNLIGRYIDTLKIKVYGVYIISWSDKSKMENKYE